MARELNAIALSEIYDSCVRSIQLLIGDKRNAAEVWKQLQSSFVVSGFASVEQQVLTVQELTCASCKPLQDFTNQLTTAKERLEGLLVSLPESYYIVQLPRSLSRPFQARTHEVRYKSLDQLNLVSETFNEEQSIKRNEAQSNINRGLALIAGKGKERGLQANKSQHDSGKDEGDSRRWKC